MEDLRDLARLLDEGKISQTEYDVVKTELLEAPADDWSVAQAISGSLPAASSNGASTTGSHESPIESAPKEEKSLPEETELVPESEESVPEDEPPATPASEESSGDESPADAKPKTPADWIEFVKQIQPFYWVAAAATVISLFYGWVFVPVAWVTAVIGAIALVAKKTGAGRWMAWVALIIGLVLSLSNIVFADTPVTVDSNPSTALASGTETLAEIPVGSLGVSLEDLPERWNALDQPPYLLAGITTTPEPGPLDSFVYRFDGGAVLAGAYNQSDDFIYALMARAGMGHELAREMYVHLCYLLYPGTQDCFDSYVENSGVFGKPDEELENAAHESSWDFEGNEWRLDIANGVQTLRVLGPQQQG